MLVGQGRVGKTCLLASLNGEVHDPKQVSTHLMALGDSIGCRIQSTNILEWTREKDELREVERMTAINMCDKGLRACETIVADLNALELLIDEREFKASHDTVREVRGACWNKIINLDEI